MISAIKPDFFHRLQRASAGEIAYRLRKKLTVRRLKSALSRGDSPFTAPAADPAHLAGLEMPRLDVQADSTLIQRLIGGETFRLNADAAAIQAFEEKHRKEFFGAVKSLPEDPDIRAVWERARLQNAALLLSCDPIHGRERRAGNDIVLWWIEANPFLRGPHYMSAMECGLRVPVFFYCLKAAPELLEEERAALLRAIYDHGWWIEKNLSLYASLGNHTVCECVGLIFAGAVFRDTGNGHQWIETGSRLLDQELTHQVLADGGPAEQSLAYHRFVLDLYWLAADFLAKNRLHDCSAWKERLSRGEAFLSAFTREGRPFPLIGNSDDGRAVGPGAAPVRADARAAPAAVTRSGRQGSPGRKVLHCAGTTRPGKSFRPRSRKASPFTAGRTPKRCSRRSRRGVRGPLQRLGGVMAVREMHRFNAIRWRRPGFLTALVLISTMGVAAVGACAEVPEKLISLEIRETPLKDVLQEIAGQTGYTFIFESTWSEHPISARVKDASIQAGLRRVLGGMNHARPQKPERSKRPSRPKTSRQRTEPPGSAAGVN